MKPIVFHLKENEALAQKLIELLPAEQGDYTLRHFPDGETYVKINSDVREKNAYVVCTMDHPDLKFLPLYFLVKTLKDLGAQKVTLVAPYLAYMRQDTRFHEGEGVTSAYFAQLISMFADELITIDPHLHRRSNLNQIYTIETTAIHASGLLSKWINSYVEKPVLIGPDSESEQWVAEVAKNSNAPYVVLEKTRNGDRDVTVSAPKLQDYLEHTPVLVDDIVSTGRTMIETMGHLKRLGMKGAICIGVHGIFADNSYQALLDNGASKVVTTNCIQHSSNGIEIAGLIVEAIKNKTNQTK